MGEDLLGWPSMPAFYRLDAAAPAIGRHFGAEAGSDPWAGGPVSPGSFAPILTTGREEIAGPRPIGRQSLRMIPRLWGVPPPPSGLGPARYGVLTVKNRESPFWIGNLRNSEFRCLIPATGWTEWGEGRGIDGKRRQLRVTLGDQPLFAFAGVWKDSEVPSFALLTCEPNAALREAGHGTGREAMPAILPPDPAAWRVWLAGEWSRAEALIAPYPSSATMIASA